MSTYLNKLKLQTRWDNFPDSDSNYRLMCNNANCSLSCANLKNGQLSVTSTHGTVRHSYALTKKDMLFMTTQFINSLSPSELDVFVQVLNKIHKDSVFSMSKL